MNPYYLDQYPQILPNYYYNSPLEQIYYQQYLASKALTLEVASQTESIFDYQPYKQEQTYQYQHLNLKKNELLQLIEADLSVIEVPKEPDQKPFGRICQPCFSIFINNCQVKVVLAKIGRIKSNILLVPYNENQLATYIGVLFKRSMLTKIQEKLQSKATQGFLSFTTSTFKSKFDIFAFTRLHNNLKDDYLAAVNNLLKNAKDLEKGDARHLLIPYSAQYQCSKELIVLVLGHVQTQKACYFTKITISCEKAEEFRQLSTYFNEVVKVYSFKDDLTV